MKVKIEKLQEFHSKLEKISGSADGKNQNKMSLTERQQGVDIAREYYAYLEASGEVYGKAALLVVNDEGFSGKTANIHLRTQAVFDGVKKEYLPELQDRIKISLAFTDIQQRIELKERFEIKDISDYHKSVFKSQGITEYAWGGLFIEELLGPGKWMMIVDTDVEKFDKLLDQLSKIKNKESGYALDRLITSAKHSFGCYTTYEHDYVPMIRAGSPEYAAKWYGVDVSRVVEYYEETSEMESPLARSFVYKILPKETNLTSNKSGDSSDKIYSEVARSYVNKLHSVANKIQGGSSLTDLESITNKMIAIDYFNEINIFNLPDVGLHLNLLKGNGSIGNISNSILFRQAKIDGVAQIKEKSDNLKIILAYYHAKAVQESLDGKIPLEKSLQIREKAFQSQGLSPYSDIWKLVNAISAPDKCYEVKQASDLGNLLQKVIVPASEQESLAGTVSNNVINLPQKIGELSSHRTISAIKDGLQSYFNPNQNTVALGPVAAPTKEVVAGNFEVPVEQVKAKFASAASSALFASSNVDKIFEIVPPAHASASVVKPRSVVFKEQAKSTTPHLNALEKVDPEFFTKLMVAPLSLQQNTKAASTDLNMSPLRQNVTNTRTVDNSKLKVTIDKSFAEAHKKQDMTTSWLTGVAMYGAQYEVQMPINVLNGNGAKNVWPSSIVTDSYRPGAQQISDFNTPGQIKSVVFKPQIGPVKMAAMMNNYQTASLMKLNIDPIIIDITGTGLELTSYAENNVLFDIDGDGYLEETGWVGPNTGILVVDKKGTGIINSIKEIVSERFEGIEAKDGFAALRRYDLNSDGIIDERDLIFNNLRVWINKDADGITKPGELLKLSDLGIKAIIVSEEQIQQCQESLADNTLKAKSYCLLTNGERREVASVDFTANPRGHKYEETEEGIMLVSESGTKSYTSKSKVSKQIDAEKLGVNNLYASEHGDTLIGNDFDNWLVSRGGSNTYLGKKGDNTLVVTAKDKLENIQAGEGFNTVLITGKEGMYFDLKQTGAHVVNGSEHGDVINAAECEYNTFIQAGDGDNLIVGGIADCALSGGRGNDIIVSGRGNSIIRSHNGNNFLIGGQGNNYLESGNGFNILMGGTGNNIFAISGSGYAIFDGSQGAYNIAEFSGNLRDYEFTKKENGDLIVKDLHSGNDSTAVLKNIHTMNFKDISNLTSSSILPAISLIPIEEEPKEITISYEQLIANHPKLTQAPLFVSEISDVQGGEIRLEYLPNKTVKSVTFKPDHNYKGLMSFSYIAISQEGETTQVIYCSEDEFNGLSGKAKSLVFFKKPSYPKDELFYQQFYLSDNNIFPLWREYTGKGVKVAISENGTYDCNHPDLKINSITTKLAPETLKAHTTAVAGVVGASINGQGSAGVAPEVNLISKDVNFKTRLDASPIVPDADIINCSFSYTKIGWHKSFGLAKANSDDALLINTIKTQIENGRSGLGTIVVFASGNQRDENGNSNYCAAKTLPYIITVGGIDKTTDIGRFEKPYKPFSNPGANLLVSAPCYQIFSTTLKLFNDYNSTFGNPHGEMFGTSFATPIVSGVIALMLQANPFLGVRDVHNILAYSAKMIEGSSGKWLFNKSKYYNGGGLHYNYDYGFGNIDATTAVRLAESWVNQNVKFKMLPIVFRDGGAMNFSKIFSAKIQKNIPNFQLEKVQLDLEGTNIKLDEVTISLTSPSGTLSVLSEARALQNPDGTKFTLDGSISPLTNHFLGEDFSGTWHIKIEAEGAKSENSSRLTAETTIGQFGKIAAYFYGTTTLNYTYVFTNEAASVYSNERSNITCPNGINTINLASLSSACEVNLQHHKLKIMNNDYIITPESKVHNIFGGEGDDIIMGNELDNILVGGRGNNIIKGNSGHNIICGGKGNNDLYSGQDADMFVIHKIPGSHNRIFDFKPYLAQEVINIVGFDKSKSFSDLIFEQKNENLLITLEEQTFMLMNTAKESIKKENFIFDEHFNFHAQFAGDHLEWSSALEHTIYQA